MPKVAAKSPEHLLLMKDSPCFWVVGLALEVIMVGFLSSFCSRMFYVFELVAFGIENQCIF